MKALRFVQVLALLPACAGAPAPQPAASAPSATATGSPTGSAVAEIPTAGDGPCRCSWETNAALAPRVCKKGETSHAGKACNAAGHKPPYEVTEGPLPPPELARY